MKYIYAVGMVKNESDVIESYCRHALEYCDGMVLCNDDSADETKEIIQKLMAEGLNIHLYDNPETVGYYQDTITNRLAQIAIETCGANLIIPIDADEFLLRPNGGNPRAVLERLSDSKAYRASWPVFLPANTNMENGVFLPSYFSEYIFQSKNFKVIAGAQLLKDGKYWITKGNHMIITTDGNVPYEAQLLKDVFMAHYPIRSAEQAMTKIIVGWANSITTPNRVKGESWHWESMYNYIKQTGRLTQEHLNALAMVYAFTDDPEPPVSTYALKTDIKLRYTDYTKAQKNFLNIILSNYEHVINVLLSHGAAHVAENVTKN